ncbi:basic amino acid ABC transporter substrate-binding protein [Bacillus massiliigorillae]|uniref:basic amino acid ABC transporter substrate-binding protein n=1 Tax=Bacillus massiliigorillae TaxID=1243664 RepID=UPI00039D2B24|nr:basic amino acid ABC transporter substrate-binding protein [Bacillus massiliigorillae]
MKKMTVGFMLLCAFLLALTGCGTKDNSKDSGDKAEKKTLRVVTDAAYAPMEFLDKDEVKGFDVDFAKAVAEAAGYDVKVDHVGWDPMFVELDNKRADMAVAAITIDKDRKKTYDFTHPYYLSTLKILVPKGSSIKSAADLKGKKVAVQGGTTGNIAAEKLLGKNSENIKKFESNNLAIMELTKGGADAVVADSAIVDEYAKNNPKDKLTVIEDNAAFGAEFYGIMLAKGNEDLQKELNKAINTIFENGKYKEIYQKWFGIDPDIELLKKQQEK